jgi:hypothetical protein
MSGAYVDDGGHHQHHQQHYADTQDYSNDPSAQYNDAQQQQFEQQQQYVQDPPGQTNNKSPIRRRWEPSWQRRRSECLIGSAWHSFLSHFHFVLSLSSSPFRSPPSRYHRA